MSNKKLKVLHLRSSGALLGAESVVLELAKHSPNFSTEAIVGIPVLAQDDIPEYGLLAQQIGLNVVLFHYDSTFSLALAKKIKKYVEQENINIVHTHGYQEDFYAWLANLQIPIIATNHLWKKTDFKLWLYAKIDAHILKSFQRVVAVSKPILDELEQVGIKKNELISNGVDTNKFSPDLKQAQHTSYKASLGISDTSVLIGMISSLSIEKGHLYALEAFKEAQESFENEVTLIIVGDGPERSNIINMAKTLGLEKNIALLGKRQDIPEILNILDIFIIPSLNEGLPISMLEAMASGLPVIATDVGDIGKVINNEENGFLINSKNSHQLAERLEMLVNDSKLRHKLALKARETIEDHFSASAMTESYCKIYQDLANL